MSPGGSASRLGLVPAIAPPPLPASRAWGVCAGGGRMETMTGQWALSDVVTISNASDTPVELAPECQREAGPSPTLMTRAVNLAALAAALLGLLGACTSGASADRTSSPTSPVRASSSSATTPSPNPTKQAADGALAAYRGFRRAEVRAEAKADPKGSGLER